MIIDEENAIIFKQQERKTMLEKIKEIKRMCQLSRITF